MLKNYEVIIHICPLGCYPSPLSSLRLLNGQHNLQRIWLSMLLVV